MAEKKVLSKLTRVELEELFVRQEKLISKMQLLKLPDKGAKLIESKKRIQDALEEMKKKEAQENQEPADLVKEFDKLNLRPSSSDERQSGSSKETPNAKIQRLLLKKDKNCSVPVNLHQSSRSSPSTCSTHLESSTSSSKVAHLSLEESLQLQEQIGDGFRRPNFSPDLLAAPSINRHETNVRKTLPGAKSVNFSDVNVSSVTKKPISRFIPYREPESESESDTDDDDDRITEESEENDDL